jgi:hypothetical protein
MLMQQRIADPANARLSAGIFVCVFRRISACVTDG